MKVKQRKEVTGSYVTVKQEHKFSTARAPNNFFI
jgi:hypothetical protein